MKEQIEEVRVPIEDIKERHRYLYLKLKSIEQDAVAVITLYSRRSHERAYAQVLECDQGYRLFCGSSALYRRWREIRKQERVR